MAENKEKKDKKPEAKKEKKPEPKAGKKPEAQKDKDEFRHRVRVLRVVIDGNLDVQRALMNIKGIGQQVSKVVTKKLKIDKKTKLGSLTERQIENIENAIKDLQNSVPIWMVNRQMDPRSGKNLHLVGPDLELAQREDINLQKKLKSYKGVRHSLGLPVRGQRTRTSFRKGTTLGVSRKKAQQAAKKEAKT